MSDSFLWIFSKHAGDNDYDGESRCQYFSLVIHGCLSSEVSLNSTTPTFSLNTLYLLVPGL